MAEPVLASEGKGIVGLLQDLDTESSHQSGIHNRPSEYRKVTLSATKRRSRKDKDDGGTKREELKRPPKTELLFGVEAMGEIVTW